MTKKGQKPEPCYEKGELRSYTHANQELRSHVHEKKSSGAVSVLGRLPSPGC